MPKKYLVLIIGIILVTLAVHHFVRLDKTVPIETTHSDNPEFRKVEEYTESTIEEKCPYSGKSQIEYDDCLNDLLDKSLSDKGLTEESQLYQSFFGFCKEYALTQGEENFGSYNLGFTNCLIYKVFTL